MRVLGIEGTAWCASAAVYDSETGDVLIESDPYLPDSGGIHPREAAEHMSDALPSVVDAALSHAEREYGPDSIDAVAFSRGPGLGPCLRTAGTAARSLAGSLSVPLVGVNHMVAHLEIGRHRSGFENPICLNASGANAHVLGYHDGRYRVLGETMDTGVGNAIDKFTRHVGWSHPGGPKVEAAAADGEFLELPYVVKGMDFSFSGIMSAAKDRYDEGAPVEDVCFALQEHVFAMLTEVAERALSLTGVDELVLGGGVGQNDRLREMLEAMCTQRDASFFAPEPRFLRDNAGMIAVLGAKMATAGDVVAIRESAVDPNFRPDEVPVTWRERDASLREGSRTERIDRDHTGAEATVEFLEDGRVRKRRRARAYRHPELDETLRRSRTTLEARLLNEARRAGVPTPLVHDVDVANATVTLQHVGERDLADALADGTDAARSHARNAGRYLARLHDAGIVHGDPTTRNVRIRPIEEDDANLGGTIADAPRSRPHTYLIDFGLGYHTGHVEDHAMDLHVLEQAVAGTAMEPEPLLDAFESGYLSVGDSSVIDRLRTIEGRGRYR